MFYFDFIPVSVFCNTAFFHKSINFFFETPCINCLLPFILTTLCSCFTFISLNSVYNSLRSMCPFPNIPTMQKTGFSRVGGWYSENFFFRKYSLMKKYLAYHFRYKGLCTPAWSATWLRSRTVVSRSFRTRAVQVSHVGAALCVLNLATAKFIQLFRVCRLHPPTLHSSKSLS